ncbi:MAG: hypothetical protein L6R37_000054 [Teloschistes peruensis]|nr:MAG: hypothetical protein L6R37_000054 [Teloschistes peruensis]
MAQVSSGEVKEKEITRLMDILTLDLKQKNILPPPNVLLLGSETRQMFVDLGYPARAAQRLKAISPISIQQTFPRSLTTL